MKFKLPSALPRPDSTFSSQSVTVLREMILTGRLKSGERLNEVAIANALGISRAPLREAIRALTNDGLLVSVPNRGAFVSTVNEQELADLYELRIALEVHAVRLVTARSSTEDFGDLGGFLDETRDRMDRGVGAVHYPGELDFHLRLVHLSKSPELLASTTSVNQRIGLARSRSGHDPERAQQAFEQHRAIVEHLRMKESGPAASLIEQHLRESLANALAIFGQDLVGE